jgi:hypothetical protein
MMLSARYPVTSTYRVEVSGWDKNQTFFVEKSELEWSEESDRQLSVTRAIPDGAVIFLRLIASLSVDRADPVAYETEFLETTLDGLHQFRLHPVSSRTAGDLDEVRKVHIQKVLELCQGNRLRAAQILGIGRTSLYRYLKRDGVGGRSDPANGEAANGSADQDAGENDDALA